MNDSKATYNRVEPRVTAAMLAKGYAGVERRLRRRHRIRIIAALAACGILASIIVFATDKPIEALLWIMPVVLIARQWR